MGSDSLRGLVWLVWCLACPGVSELLASSFYVNYSQGVELENVLAHPESILHPDVALDPNELTAAGHVSLGYLSVGEIGADARYRSRAVAAGIARPIRNEVWNSEVVDLGSAAWRDFVIQDLASKIVARGFSGFFLDTMDAVDLLVQRFPERSELFRNGLIALVRSLREAYPDHRIVVNRGFSVLDELLDSVDGVLVESVFGTVDLKKETYRTVAEQESMALLARLNPLSDAGKDIYVLDYADPDDIESSMNISLKALDRGFRSFVSTPALDGISVAPLRSLPRKVLVLYGNDPSQGPWAPRYPFDSSTFLTLHMCFEWLGVEVEYLNAYRNAFRFDRSGGYCAILTDQTLVVPNQYEQAFVDAVIEAKNHGVKVLFAGHIPISGWVQTQRLFRALGISGTGDLIPNIESQKILKKDSDIMDFKERVRMVPFNNLDLQAPSDADVFLSVECQTVDEKRLVYDAVFSAPWGGVLFEPYLFFTRPNFDDLWLLDPFEFLSRALSLSPFPVPDTTTRDGVRLFYSHIDGDGFANISEVDPNRRSSEIVRDFILTKYPFPITYSVIEAEVEALSMLQTSDAAEELREIARSIFSLPNIQVASHAYSHPFYWIEDDPRQEIYPTRHLPLKNNYRFSLDREIEGSIEYINRELAPEGKEVELFLWSGNCRPSVEALRKVRELGMLNMNGGDTLISTAKPSLSFVSPRTLFWDGEVQILAANQNENVYTHDWTGPYFGMYSKVIDTFQKTELPKRLKPVNVYFHNYCGDKPDGLQSLRTVFDWVQEQPLHAVTALDYAKIARDSRFTAVYARSDRHFVMVNGGHLRTFRVPKDQLIPDISLSSGIVGFNEHGGFQYVHTDGRRRVELVMGRRSENSGHPYLVQSTGEIDWLGFGPAELRFRVGDHRPVEVTIGGLRPGDDWQLAVGATEQTMTAGADGRLELQLPNEAEVRLTPAAPNRDE